MLPVFPMNWKNCKSVYFLVYRKKTRCHLAHRHGCNLPLRKCPCLLARQTESARMLHRVPDQRYLNPEVVKYHGQARQGQLVSIPYKPPRGVYFFHGRDGGLIWEGDLFNLAKVIVLVVHKELKYKVEKRKHKKSEVMQQRIKNKFELPVGE